jgi:hypothetical protein
MPFTGTHSKSPRGIVLGLRAFILALPLLTSPILLIRSMGPQDPQYSSRGYSTAFDPQLIADGEPMTRAFVWGTTILVLLIRLRLPADAAAWKRKGSLLVAYVLAGFTYFLCFTQTAAGAGGGWMAYGVFLILLAVTVVSVGRYGYDLGRSH